MRAIPLLVVVVVIIGVVVVSTQAVPVSGQTVTPTDIAQFASVQPKNLQVLPKDTSMKDVLLRMDIMVEALGVQCDYCHKTVGRGSLANEFASDEKRAKNVARIMMRLDGLINGTLAAQIDKPAEQLSKVRCITCHRGAAVPFAPSNTVSPTK